MSVFRRCNANPILTVGHLPMAAGGVLNPGAAEHDGEVVLLVRVEDVEGFSSIHVARSHDGIDNWQFDPQPLLGRGHADHPYEQWGCEDPRVVYLSEHGCWYITYVAYSSMGPCAALARTNDFRTVERVGLLGSTNDKDAALFSHRICGRWSMLHRPQAGGTEHIWVTRSNDLKHWGDPACVMFEGEGPRWDHVRIGVGPPPLLITEGWLLIYHGVKAYGGHLVYRVGLALLARDRPTCVIARSRGWVFQAEAAYETAGLVPNVVFPTGALRRGDQVWMYYGAADSRVCLAIADLSDLTGALQEVRRS